MTGAKHFLRENKIYLETFSYLIVGITSLIVGVASLYIAKQANHISQSQLSIAAQQSTLAEQSLVLTNQTLLLQREASQPVIEPVLKLVEIKDGRRVEELEIHASRHPVFDVRAILVGQVVVEKLRKSMEPAVAGAMFDRMKKSTLLETATIPLGVLAGRITIQENTLEGLILRMPIANPHIESEIETTLAKSHPDPAIEFDVDIQRLLKVSFYDNEGTFHVKFFDLEVIVEPKPIQSIKAEALYDRLSSSLLSGNVLHPRNPERHEIINWWIKAKAAPGREQAENLEAATAG